MNPGDILLTACKGEKHHVEISVNAERLLELCLDVRARYELVMKLRQLALDISRDYK